MRCACGKDQGDHRADCAVWLAAISVPDHVMQVAAREYWTRRPSVYRVESHAEAESQWDQLPEEVRAWYIALLQPTIAAAIRALG